MPLYAVEETMVSYSESMVTVQKTKPTALMAGFL